MRFFSSGSPKNISHDFSRKFFSGMLEIYREACQKLFFLIIREFSNFSHPARNYSESSFRLYILEFHEDFLNFLWKKYYASPK